MEIVLSKEKKIISGKIKAEFIEITKILSNKRKNKQQSIKEALKKIDRLRFEYSFDELQKLYDSLPIVCKQMILNRNLASTQEMLGRGAYGFQTEELKKQLNWFSLIILQHKEKINSFLNYKKEFEYAFLHGKYQEAENVVQKISTKVSYSFWGLHNTWLLKEYAYSIADRIKYLSELGNKSNDNIIFLIFSIFFGDMVEKDISIQRYLDKVETEIYHSYKIHDRPIRFFIESYLNPNQVYFFKSTSGIFFGDEESTIIDLYLNFQRILLNRALNGETDVKILQRLLLEINDEKLENIQLLSAKDKLEICKNNPQKIVNAIEILDEYTKENYTKSITLAAIFLQEYPDAIDICEIYVKSHIYLNKTIISINNEESTLNKILKNMYEILIKSDKTDEAISELNNLAFNLATFDISKQLLFFLSENTEKKNLEIYRKISKVYSPILTPNVVDILEKDKKVYLENLKDIIVKDSITINFFEQLLLFNENTSNSINIKIPTYRIILHKTRILFNKQEYSLTIKLVESIIDEIVKFPHLLSEGLLYLYNSYLQTEEVNKCIELYVNYFFKNKNLVNNISINSAIPLITRNRFQNVSHSIILPIFFHISKTKEYLLFSAYRLFMRSKNIKKPSELDYLEFNLDCVIFFFKNICVQKVLCTDALSFRSQIELDNERVKICQILAKIDSVNTEEYNNEIGEITQNNKIKERIDEIDNSKIYVDIAGIKNYDLKDFYSHYMRYQKTLETLSLYEEELQFLSLENSAKELENNAHTKKNYLGSKQQLEKIFIELFTEIRDIYLFSNGNGLDYYLSTRIRHGIIEGQLRKTFSNNGLITIKDSETKEYKNNTALIETLNIDDKYKNSLYSLFNNFSSEIDNLITIIKDEYIHIKTENINTKQNGGFVFSKHTWYSSLILTFNNASFIDIKNDQDFIDKCFHLCNDITNFNLKKIQKFFNNNIKLDFVRKLDALESDLKQYTCKHDLNVLFSKIAHCRTDIQKEIDLIASWFEQRSKKYMDFLIEDAVDTSSEIIRNIFPIVKLNIQKNINSNLLLQGTYFTHFVDCFKIFFENIANYSKKNHMQEIDVFIEIKSLEDNIQCTICNSIEENTKIEDMQEIINKQNDAISKNLNTSITRQDRNSGLIKATNIIKNVIGNHTNSIEMMMCERTVCLKFDVGIKRCERI